MIGTLPEKFHPYLIGHPKCCLDPAAQDQIKNILSQPKVFLKSNVLGVGKWILKHTRTDFITTEDTHLYRVRKAEKVRRYIEANGLQEELIVPKKWICRWREDFWTVSEKIDLSEEVASPIKGFQEWVRPEEAAQVGGQLNALCNLGKPRREINPTQARALAELSILGYTDLTYNNLYFDKAGKVAIIDTEPVKRALKKEVFAGSLPRFFGDKGGFLSMQAVAGIAKLKMVCGNPEALKAVESVETRLVVWTIAKLVAKLALAIFVMWNASPILAVFPLGGAVLVLKPILIAIAVIKTISLLSLVASNSVLWMLSRHRTPDSVEAIAQMELNGAF